MLQKSPLRQMQNYAKSLFAQKKTFTFHVFFPRDSRSRAHVPSHRLALRNCALGYRPIFTKIPKYGVNTSNGSETITVSKLFRRTVFTLTGLAIFQLSQTRSALKIATHRSQHRPAWCGERTAVFSLASQVRLDSCAVASGMWKSYPVTRSPSC